MESYSGNPNTNSYYDLYTKYFLVNVFSIDVRIANS
jgi:hypothetical protein